MLRYYHSKPQNLDHAFKFTKRVKTRITLSFIRHIFIKNKDKNKNKCKDTNTESKTKSKIKMKNNNKLKMDIKIDTFTDTTKNGTV